MHAWIYQLSDEPIEELIDEDTINQGDGTDYDYCADISDEERKDAVERLWTEILPKGMFNLLDGKTLLYYGGFHEWKYQWVKRIQHKASLIDSNNVMEFVGAAYQLEREIKNPLGTDSHFYLCGDCSQSFAEESVELMRWIGDLKVGSKIYIGGIVDFHF